MARTVTVGDIMTQEVRYLSIPGTRDQALEGLQDYKVSVLPVLKGEKVVGIITHKDILRNPEEEQLAILMNRNVITTEPGVSMGELTRIFIDTGLRRLPVIRDGKLVGIVAISDLVESISQMELTTPVGELAGNGVVAVWDQTPVKVVAEILQLSDREALPVLNGDLELVGVIGLQDLLALVSIEDKVQETAMSAGTDEDAWTWESMRDTMKLYYGVSSVSLPDKKVSDVMVHEVVTASPQTTASECARKMRRHQIEQVPIINADSKLRGMVIDRDIIRALLVI